MDPLLVDILGAAVRWALTLAASWLVQHQFLAADQSSTFVSRFLPLLTSKITMGAALLAPLAWSAVQKIRARIRLNTALELPAGSTAHDVTAAVKSGGGAGALQP